MPIDIDLHVGISKKGVKLEVKNVDVNNFVIDKIFKRIDKKSKRNKPVKEIQDKNNQCYNIDIKI